MGNLATSAQAGAGEPEQDLPGAPEFAPPSPPDTPDTPDTPSGPTQRRPLWKELPVLVVVALVLALLIKTVLVQAFYIPSPSMTNTLQIGDRVLVDKLTPLLGSGPSRGEVVVFKDPAHWLDAEETQQSSSNPVVRGAQSVFSWIGLLPAADQGYLIKRVIAVGGDTVSCQGSGPVYVNGKALDEPYVYPGATPCGDRNFGPLKVPADSIWVMGDHRNDSSDSRYHQDEPGGGAVPDSDVVGRAIVVAWPVTHWSDLPIPDTFSQPGIGVQAASAPAALGVFGAVPVTLLVRRRRRRRASSSYSPSTATGTGS
ncbi:signal peptidase I [Kitasatospora sp. NBC_01266]|uniref:signal peptidase I n=1 Tax=Kitasatospora sp. NBC_01266 TaxID=2903572 RepID=UPI002E36E256|nr:signal peptidase I [Kitasatospora sp. NBC_01266]